MDIRVVRYHVQNGVDRELHHDTENKSATKTIIFREQSNLFNGRQIIIFEGSTVYCRIKDPFSTIRGGNPILEFGLGQEHYCRVEDAIDKESQE